MKTVGMIEWLAPRGMNWISIASAIVLCAMVFGRVASAQPIYNPITNCYDAPSGVASFCPNAGNGGAGGGQAPAVGYDPCFVKQNAMRPCPPGNGQPKPVGVDRKIVGTWKLPLKDGPWVLEIRRDGTYKFHSEAGDGVAAHEGTFAASKGQWLLKAANGYTDGGTYSFQGLDTWVATGRLGTGRWRHD